MAKNIPSDPDAPGKPAVDLTRKTGQGPPDDSSPKSPTDRDETVGMTDGAPSETIKQGSRDVKRGLQDTSRGPEADNAYQKQK